MLKDQAWDVIDTMAQKYQGSFDWIVVEPRGRLQRWKTMIESQFLFWLASGCRSSTHTHCMAQRDPGRVVCQGQVPAVGEDVDFE